MHWWDERNIVARKFAATTTTTAAASKRDLIDSLKITLSPVFLLLVIVANCLFRFRSVLYTGGFLPRRRDSGRKRGQPPSWLPPQMHYQLPLCLLRNSKFLYRRKQWVLQVILYIKYSHHEGKKVITLELDNFAYTSVVDILSLPSTIIYFTSISPPSLTLTHTHSHTHSFTLSLTHTLPHSFLSHLYCPFIVSLFSWLLREIEENEGKIRRTRWWWTKAKNVCTGGKIVIFGQSISETRDGNCICWFVC